MESISQRYFIEKVDTMIIGNSKVNMKKNQLNLDKYADTFADGISHTNWRCQEDTSSNKNSIYFDMVENLNATFDKQGNMKRYEL